MNEVIRKNAAMLDNAAVVSSNLKVKVFRNRYHTTTKGKAYLAEQIQINEDYVESTVLQQNIEDDWIAFRVVHPSNESVSKQFTKLKSHRENFHLAQAPLYVAFVMLGILYGILIKVTVFDQRPLIIEQSMWFDIGLITIIFLLTEIFIIYVIYTLFMDFSYFRTTRSLKSEAFILRYEDKPQNITATVFHGQFFVIDEDSDLSKVFGPAAGDWEDTLVTEQGLPYSDVITQLQADKYELMYTLRDKFRITIHLKRKITTHSFDEFEGLTEEQRSEQKENLEKLKTEYQEKQEEYESLEREINPQIEEIDKTIAKLEEDYYAEIAKLAGEHVEKQHIDQIANSESIITQLKFENANLKIKNMRLSKTVAGQFDESMEAGLDFEERALHKAVFDFTQREKIKYDIENRLQNGHTIPNYASEDNGRFGGSFDTSMNLGTIIELSLKLGMLVLAVVIISNAFKTILSNAANVGWPAAVLMGIILILVIMAWAWSSNKINRSKNYKDNSQTLDMR